MIERSIIATIVAHPFLVDDYDIKEEYFDEVNHKKVIRSVRSLQSKGQSIDVITVDFENSQYADGKSGELSFLHNYTRYEDYGSFESYQEQIVDRWKDREKLKLFERGINDNLSIDVVRSELDRIDKQVVNDEMTSSDIVRNLFNTAFEPLLTELGASTGINTLDNSMSGLRGNKLIVVAGRPGMGKTDFALQLLRSAATNYYVDMFSLEMESVELGKRLIASQGRYIKQKLIDPEKSLANNEKERWPTVMGELGKLNYSIYDKSGQTVDEIKRKVRTSINNRPELKHVVIIDYLQIMGYGKEDDDVKAIGKITRELKGMAKEFDIPVILLAQLNRGVEQRTDKRPMMSDLRGSGEIEQDK